MSIKEDLLAAGYVHIGYFSPPLSTEETYPDYIKANVTDAISKIKSVLNENSVSIDRENRKIYTTRIGAGEDREVTY